MTEPARYEATESPNQFVAFFGGARAMLGLGRVAMSMGDLDSAMAAFREALERAPDSYPAWVAASEACERAGDGSSAMQAIETALGMAPADPTVLRVAVRLLCAAGEEERAGRIRDRARALGAQEAA